MALEHISILGKSIHCELVRNLHLQNQSASTTGFALISWQTDSHKDGICCSLATNLESLQ